MINEDYKSAIVIVAHPDDETLWLGGEMLIHPNWNWFVVCLCRKNDNDRAPKFYKALKELHAEGIMGDMNDGSAQTPLDETDIENAILKLIPKKHFDIIYTHNPSGEYTRHIRHEEIGKAVIVLWNKEKISVGELYVFAYEDGNRAYNPIPVLNATFFNTLTKEVWLRKYNIITKIYGFDKDSWEAKSTPENEAFWRFSNPEIAMQWLENGEVII